MDIKVKWFEANLEAARKSRKKWYEANEKPAEISGTPWYEANLVKHLDTKKSGMKRI